MPTQVPGVSVSQRHPDELALKMTVRVTALHPGREAYTFLC